MRAKIRLAQKWQHYSVYLAERAEYRVLEVKGQLLVDYQLYLVCLDHHHHTKCFWKHHSVDQNR